MWESEPPTRMSSGPPAPPMDRSDLNSFRLAFLLQCTNVHLELLYFYKTFNALQKMMFVKNLYNNHRQDLIIIENNTKI
jgi:hypothetical protein